MALIRKYFWLGAAVALALGAIFAFLGVYDSDQLPFYMRFVFWTLTMITGTAATALAGPWVFNRLLPGRNLVLQLALVSAVISLPVWVVILGITASLTGHWPFNDLLLQFLRIFTVSFIVVSGGYAGARMFGMIGDTTQDHKTPAGDSPVQKFLERLPAKYRGAALYGISSEDHYLRIHTDRGEELILMRLSDAIRELDGADGLQIHRSWWVAHNGVKELSRDNGKQKLILKSGVEAPVSRSFAKAVRDADLDG